MDEPAKTATKQRLQFDFKANEVARIKRIAEANDTTMSDTVREALVVLELIMDTKARGAEIAFGPSDTVVTEPDGTKTRIVFARI